MLLKSLLNKSIIELHKAGIPTPELDAKVLLVAAMTKQDAFVYSHPDYLITNAQYAKFRRYIRRRKTGEPIAYITGHKEFYGYNFFVNKNVLVPRPESEWLVDAGISFLQNKVSGIMNNAKQNCHSGLDPESRKIPKQVQHDNINILDMGTGSGCIAISLYNSIHNSKFLIHNSIVKIYAVDFNNRAVAVAKKNARELKAKNIVFLNSDLFGNRRIKNKIFNLIFANLPYVPRTKKVLNSQFSILNSIAFEPQAAIFADDNGAAIIKRFLKEARDHTKTGSVILIELDPRNAIDLLEFSRHYYPTAKIDLKKDLAGLNRYLIIKI